MDQSNDSVSVKAVQLCLTGEVSDGEARRVEVVGFPPLAVFNVEGEFFVTDDTCTHGEASLAEGTLEGATVECPWHSGSFCLRTGQALAFPAVTGIRIYPATVVGGHVCIGTSDEG